MMNPARDIVQVPKVISLQAPSLAPPATIIIAFFTQYPKRRSITILTVAPLQSEKQGAKSEENAIRDAIEHAPR